MVSVPPLLAWRVPWLVKVVGLIVIVPPASNPALIANTGVVPEKSSKPLTLATSASPLR